jgi:hypothetical protein
MGINSDTRTCKFREAPIIILNWTIGINRECVRQKLEISIFSIIDLFFRIAENAFAFRFSAFCTWTDLHIKTYSFVLFGLSLNNFCVYNSDINYCILQCHSSCKTLIIMWQVCCDCVTYYACCYCVVSCSHVTYILIFMSLFYRLYNFCKLDCCNLVL